MTEEDKRDPTSAPSRGAKIMVHPVWSDKVPGGDREPPGPAPSKQTLVKRGASWMVDGEELFNGCFLELRLTAPRLWLAVWIEGLPDAPCAHFVVADGREGMIALAEGDAVRWPRKGVDGALVDHLRRAETAPRPCPTYSQTSATKPK